MAEAPLNDGNPQLVGRLPRLINVQHWIHEEVLLLVNHQRERQLALRPLAFARDVDLEFNGKGPATAKVKSLIDEMSTRDASGEHEKSRGLARKGASKQEVPLQQFNLALVDTSEMKVKGESIK